MAVTRLANACEVRRGGKDFRYIIEGPIHEATDPRKTILVLDSYDGSTMVVSELLLRLPADLRKRLRYS
jgi:hypothetical protein